MFHRPLSQAEGFLRSVLSIMGLDLEPPDHTTLSRRGRGPALDLRAVPDQGPVHLLIDSSGSSAHGEGEWAAAKHGAKGRRGGRKRISPWIGGGRSGRSARRLTPPSTAPTSSRKPRTRAGPRARTIQRVQEVGRRAWKKEAGYHQQARAENALFRCKTIVGGRLRARSEAGRRVDARIACGILNRMTELGRPRAIPIGA